MVIFLLLIRNHGWRTLHSLWRRSELSLPSKGSKVRSVQRWRSARWIDVWHWVRTVVQPFWQNPPRPQCSLCRLLCRVTWLNANDARTEWLSIRMDRGVSWVPDDWTLHPQESKGIRLYWQKRWIRHTSCSMLMMPARNDCPSGWTEEYHGYLMTEHYTHKSQKEFVCIDKNAEYVRGTQANTNGALLYFVEGTCGSHLPCGPYVSGRELTCAVCTKWKKDLAFLHHA